MVQHPRVSSDEEERYFKELELETRARLRKNLEKDAAALADQRQVARQVGTEDLDLAERVRKLGFDGDKARVFDLLPLVWVAWADGTVTRSERATILGVLERRGVAPGSPPFQVIESLLEERPTDTYLQQALEVLRDVLADKPAATDTLVDLCVAVADASGGFLGLGNRISGEERAQLAAIVQTLGAEAESEFRKHFG